MNLTAINEHPHLRYNPLLGEWVQVSPHRTGRPWHGHVETGAADSIPTYDPDCYLCPGNMRSGGATNPSYETTFVFSNDFPALVHSTPQDKYDASGLLHARTERGICRVVCFSPRHDLTLSRMRVDDIRAVVDVWATEYQALSREPWIKYVLIFENRGSMMGASNPHPHCQIWATETLPNEPAKELAAFTAYNQQQGTCLLCAYLKLESRFKERVVCENDEFVTIVPFWAIWPFETILISKQHLGAIADLQESQRNALADILKRMTVRYDNLFHVSFPYTMGFHQHPTNATSHIESHLHAHFYPPLLRSATVRKFMVGFEMLGTPQRDITPEAAAARLRETKEGIT